jgi:hypothetical protein
MMMRVLRYLFSEALNLNLSDRLLPNLRRRIAVCLITTLFVLISFVPDAPIGGRWREVYQGIGDAC